MKWGRSAVFASIAIIGGVYAIAIAPAFVGFPEELDAVIGTTQFENVPGGESISSGALGMTFSHSIIGFGALVPGESSAAVELEVTNSGALPFTLSVSATDMTDEASGASIPASKISYATSASGAAQSLAEEQKIPDLSLLPGETTSIFLRLKAPYGGSQWLPAGDYQGSITITAKGV
jgi:hypothetical protein